MQTRMQLRELAEQVAEYVAEDTLAIFDVYQSMLDAASLGDAVEAKKSKTAGWRKPPSKWQSMILSLSLRSSTTPTCASERWMYVISSQRNFVVLAGQINPKP